jgi:hypothetical protein
MDGLAQSLRVPGQGEKSEPFDEACRGTDIGILAGAIDQGRAQDRDMDARGGGRFHHRGLAAEEGGHDGLGLGAVALALGLDRGRGKRDQTIDIPARQGWQMRGQQPDGQGGDHLLRRPLGKRHSAQRKIGLMPGHLVAVRLRSPDHGDGTLPRRPLDDEAPDGIGAAEEKKGGAGHC